MARACTSMSGMLSVLTSRRWAPIQAGHRFRRELSTDSGHADHRRRGLIG